MPVRVRVYEFYAPIAARYALSSDTVYPDHENSYNVASPLLRLLEKGDVERPTMSLSNLNDLSTEAFLLAGRYDHTCDYRTQLALGSHYKSHRVFLVDDDHVFHKVDNSGRYAFLVQAVLLKGIRAPETEAVLRDLKELTWVER